MSYLYDLFFHYHFHFHLFLDMFVKRSASRCCSAFAKSLANFSLALLIEVLLIKKACISKLFVSLPTITLVRLPLVQ